jgi:hypothetical protein
MSDENRHWGLNAYGVDEPFEVSLHDRIDGNAWELELRCGATIVAVQIVSPKEVALILAFMTENYGKTSSRPAKEGEFSGIPVGTTLFSEVASMRIETSGEIEARICKDGELPDRFCFSLLGKGFRVHADLHDPETSKLITALRQVSAEMTNG